MEISKERKLINLFEQWSGDTVDDIAVLPRSGSYREYFRLKNQQHSVIGVHNEDLKENIAFISFSKHFFQKGLRVPEIFAIDLENSVYLQEDLGDTTLFNFLLKHKQDDEFSPQLIEIYKKVVTDLPDFQVNASNDLDYSVCYPRSSFDKQSMMWDLNYFKYYFLKLAKVPFDEQELEDDFQQFSDYLLQADRAYFLYRDFQSRNIMILDNEPFFIDYQGGRKGALQYDLASLLYDAKADIPPALREVFLETYLDKLQSIIPIDRKQFKEFYQGFVLIRIMQAMGAYGFRGFYEKKTHFLQSIPYALQNLGYLLEELTLPVKLPALLKVWTQLVESPQLRSYKDYGNVQNRLKVMIHSFSYKKGIPIDQSEHGGGFVFDCRAMHNPGRYEEYQNLTGLDTPVIDFLEEKSKITSFLENIYDLVDLSVDNYIERNFSHLMINFGCTGGQHRSVYCAEKLMQHLNEKYNIEIQVKHRELERYNFL